MSVVYHIILQTKLKTGLVTVIHAEIMELVYQMATDIGVIVSEVFQEQTVELVTIMFCFHY